MGNDMYNEEQLAATHDLEAARDRARLASRAVVAEREIAGAHGLLTAFGIPEQMPPFKTPLAPLHFRLRRLEALREQEIYLAARAKQSHEYDLGALRAEINRLLWRVARLTIALRPLAALAPAYAESGLDGAIVTVQVPDSDDPRNVQLLPAHAVAAASALADEPSEVAP